MKPKTHLTRAELEELLIPPGIVDDVLAMSPAEVTAELRASGIDPEAARQRLMDRLAAFGLPAPVPAASAAPKPLTPAERLARAREMSAKYLEKFAEVRRRLAEELAQPSAEPGIHYSRVLREPSHGAERPTGRDFLGGNRLPDLQLAFNNRSAELDEDARAAIARDLAALAEMERELTASGAELGGPLLPPDDAR